AHVGGTASALSSAHAQTAPSSRAARAKPDATSGSSTARGLIDDPLNIRREPIDHRDSYDLRKFVGVLRADRRFHIVIAGLARLHDEWSLLRSFDFALPV